MTLQTGFNRNAFKFYNYDRVCFLGKRAAINPNLAAVFVEESSKMKLMPGDYIAVGITGSNPAVNIALYSAIQVMELILK